MGFTQTTARGANFKSLVANDETAFNVLKFRTYQKVVKLTDNRQGNLEKKLEWYFSYYVLTCRTEGVQTW